MVRAFLRLYSDPQALRGFRSVPVWVVFLLVVALVPQARILLTAGFMGGLVIGAALIIARHKFGSSGPRRGSPIVLFPRPVTVNVSTGRA
jgi:hypothetical protein